VFFFSSRRRHTRWPRDWSSDVCSSDLGCHAWARLAPRHGERRLGELALVWGLTIWLGFSLMRQKYQWYMHPSAPAFAWLGAAARSEERRVGKECGWAGGAGPTRQRAEV